MNAAVMDQFFAPMATDLVDTLVGQYRAQRQQIEQVAETLSGGLGSVVDFFISGNADKSGHGYCPAAKELFKPEGAIKSLNAHYWSKALSMTDVLDVMPQARRDEWHASIHEMTTPDFESETVRATLGDMLASRAKFLAERVDGIFRALSHEHVTNRPEGFGKRMILNCVLSEYGNSTTQQGHINDLRCVIAKFMGRDEPGWGVTGNSVKIAKRQWGEWLTLDGGALKLRVYKKGTGHLEVHPDMAWRLNAILASLYPAAIPEQHRRPPPRKVKDIPLMDRPLPFAVVAILADMEDGVRIEKNTGDYRRREFNYISVRNSLKPRYGSDDNHASKQASDALRAIGGVFEDGLWRFDYPPREVVDQIVASGCIPDHKSHQFYPTPESLARMAVDLAEIEDGQWCLEPSAGIGNLVQFMPVGSVAVEVSALHCEVLRQRFAGCAVHEADFLKWSASIRFDRVVMNPPFDQGRWRAHLERAASLLDTDGRLVAILPTGAKTTKDLLPGMKLAWHGPYENQFPGASVSVVILVAGRA